LIQITLVTFQSISVAHTSQKSIVPPRSRTEHSRFRFRTSEISLQRSLMRAALNLLCWECGSTFRSFIPVCIFPQSGRVNSTIFISVDGGYGYLLELYSAQDLLFNNNCWIICSLMCDRYYREIKPTDIRRWPES
jgi:hypothetical protein